MSEAKIRIMEVAAEQFMERGYEVVKLKDLAEILEIKQPSLYYHFPDGKEQIFTEVVLWTLEKVNSSLIEIISEHGDDLRYCLIRIGKWAEEDMLMSPVTMFRIDLPALENPQNRQKISLAASSKLFTPIEDLFVMAKERGEMREVSTTVAAGILLSMLESMDDRINMRVPDKMVVWEQSIDILLHGIGAK